MEGGEVMSKAEEKLEALAIAGYVAPRMRSAPETTRKRRIKRVDKDGNVVGETTVEEIQKALLAKRAIEFDVADGVKKRESLACRLCGRIFNNKKTGRRTQFCDRCKVLSCSKCGKPGTCRTYKNDLRVCRECRIGNSRNIEKCSACGASKYGYSTMCRSCFIERKKLTKKKYVCPDCDGTMSGPPAQRCRACAYKALSEKMNAEKQAMQCTDCSKPLNRTAKWAKTKRCAPCARSYRAKKKAVK